MNEATYNKKILGLDTSIITFVFSEHCNDRNSLTEKLKKLKTLGFNIIAIMTDIDPDVASTIKGFHEAWGFAENFSHYCCNNSNSNSDILNILNNYKETDQIPVEDIYFFSENEEAIKKTKEAGYMNSHQVTCSELAEKLKKILEKDRQMREDQKFKLYFSEKKQQNLENNKQNDNISFWFKKFNSTKNLNIPSIQLEFFGHLDIFNSEQTEQIEKLLNTEPDELEKQAILRVLLQSIYVNTLNNNEEAEKSTKIKNLIIKLYGEAAIPKENPNKPGEFTYPNIDIKEEYHNQAPERNNNINFN